jgi:uncharacterized cupin superfamily protein
MEKLRPIAALGVTPIVEASYPEPFKARMGRFQCRLLGDAFGLTQFGANLEILAPGAQSALRHWHSLSDEFVYVLEGELVLRTDDGETLVSAGMCVGFKAGTPNGHHFINRSAVEARFLVVGTRVTGDVASYPDDDIMWCGGAAGSYVAHKDGTPYRDRSVSDQTKP